MIGTMETLGSGVADTARAALFRLLRFHLHDWVAIFGLAILDGVLNIIHPFYRYVGKSMIDDYMFPLKKNTIPFEAVPVIALVIPFVFFVLYYLYKKDIVDLHHATLGLFFSVLLTAVITDAVKDAVGRPRPDFFWRCFPDGIPIYKNSTLEVLCNGDPGVIREGHKSFPSGHTSWSFAGLSFLSLYISGKIQLFDRRGHAAKLIIVFLPVLGALLVGLSRVDDYWHHWQDVFAGALLGLTLAVLCYRQFFPALHDVNCMGPFIYAHVEENTQSGFHFWHFRRTATPGDWPPANGPAAELDRRETEEIPL
eukprot:c18283_g1_i1 orf=344-1273(+)